MSDRAVPTLDASPCVENTSDPSILSADIRARYHVAEELVALGSRSLRMLKIEDTSRLLDAIGPDEFAVDERLPYWAELWPSSRQLALFCLNETPLGGKTVLELGCGLGLAGIAAAAAGAHVVFTDYEPDALRFARLNAWANLPPDVYTSETEFRLLDWRSPGLIHPVDLVIGADIAYERPHFIPLLNIVHMSLKSDGVAVFADPDRSTGMAFFALAEQQGFKVTLWPRQLNDRGKEKTIVLGILRLSRDPP